MNPIEVRAASGLAFVYVLRMLGLFMVMPVLAVATVKYPDYSPLLLGLAIGGYGLTQAMLQIPMGVLSDRIGRKPIIVIGLIVFALGSLVAASADSMSQLVLGRILQGAGAIASAIMALAGDVSRDSERSKVMAIIGISIGMSFYISLFLGPLVNDQYGLAGLFYVTGVLAILCIPIILFWVPSANNISPSGDTLPNVKDLTALFREPRLAKLNISVMMLHVMITLLFSQLPPLLLQYIPLSDHWQLYFPVLVCSVILMGLLMTIARRGYETNVLRVAIGLLALAFLGFMLWSASYTGLFVAAVLFFTGFNYLEANFPSAVSSISPAGKKGSAMGIFATFQFSGAFLGGVLAGILQQWFDNQTIFLIASGLCAIWITLFNRFDSTEPLKRYTLSVSLKNTTAEYIGEQLYTLEGVKDVTIVAQDNTAYLKVDTRTFDLQRAIQIATEQRT